MSRLVGLGSRVLAVGVVLVAATACSSGSEPAPSQDMVTAEKEFLGTPDEWYEQYMACLREQGFESFRGDGFVEVELAGRSDEEYLAADDHCTNDVVGHVPHLDLSEEELRARYEWRAEQYRCAVEHGFMTGEPISFEQFVALYEETGYTDWSFTADFDPFRAAEVRKVCPDSKEVF